MIGKALAATARDKAASEAATGDGTRAVAWAIIYLADVMKGKN